MSHIRVSSAGACPRRVQYEAWGIVGLPPWEGTERAFEEGNIHEASILRWAAEHLPGAPYVIHDEQKEVIIFYNDKELLRGHIDGLATNHEGRRILVEAKALARRGFEELRKNGVKQAHPQYYLQVQLYLHALGLETGYLIARNKETPKTRYWDHHIEEITYDEDYVASELKRLNELLDKIETNEELLPPYNPYDNWNCRLPYCPYVHLCYPDYYEQATRPKQLPKQDNLEEVVAEYVDLSNEINGLSKRRDELKDIIIGSVGNKPVIAGRYEVCVKERLNERIDTKAVRDLLPAEVLQNVIKVTSSKVLEVKEVNGRRSQV